MVRMREMLPCTSSLLLALALIPAVAAAQAPATRSEPKEPRWSVEAVGGLAVVAPADLNADSANLEASYSTYYDALVAYNAKIRGAGFTSSLTKDGEFPRVDRAWSGGVRIAYRLFRRIEAVAGFDALSRGQSARIKRQYHEAVLANPNARAFESDDTTTYDFANEVAVRAYSASAGVRLGIVRTGPLNVDAVVQAGPAWTRCRLGDDYTRSTSFYRGLSTTSIHLSGSGTAASVEAGARAGWNVSRRWGVFVEATYLRQRFSTIDGPSQFAREDQSGDATSAEKKWSFSSSGRWRMIPASLTTDFVTYDKPYPAVSSNTVYAPFTLDLSGTRLRVGLALRLW